MFILCHCDVPKVRLIPQDFARFASGFFDQPEKDYIFKNLLEFLCSAFKLSLVMIRNKK